MEGKHVLVIFGGNDNTCSHVLVIYGIYEPSSPGCYSIEGHQPIIIGNIWKVL